MAHASTILLVALLLCLSSFVRADEDTEDVVTLPIGKARGVKANDDLLIFKGIRYGTYQKRFETSRLVTTLAEKGEIYNATQFGSSCPQNSRFNFGSPESEDCLFLNIWAPKNKPKNAKVMVFIHGGGYIQGSGNDIYIDGIAHAKKGIILVTFNYRLAIFGFFAHPDLTLEDPENPTNFGLLDQIVALKWVKKYISFFGGNPEDITVFGESAGANSIQWLMAHKDHSTNPLFTKAIMQSTPASAFPHELNESESYGADFATQLGCVGPNSLSCLRKLSYKKLSSGSWSRRTFSPTVTPLPYSPTRMFTPHTDYKNFPVHPAVQGIKGNGKSHKIIIGTTQHEWMFFMWIMHTFKYPSDEWMHDSIDLIFSSPYFTNQSQVGLSKRLEELYPRTAYPSGLDRVSAIHTDMIFYCPSRSYAQKLVEQGAEVHFYLFSHEATYGNKLLKSYHASELPFVFQKTVKDMFGGLVKLFPTNFTSSEIELSDNIIKIWAEYGEQTNVMFGDKLEWKPFSAIGENYLEIAIPPKMVLGSRLDEKCAFWDEVLPSPQQAIIFDLMAHEPFLLKAINEFTIDLLLLLFKKGKFVGLISISFVFVLLVWCRKAKKSIKKKKRE
eukprot:Phypoly_transcript_05571.p1 GENE.Phypoly_transcript_05571~~Phypoly_transcript_05571.p1  ORF type:complete len:613 (+),score=76.19 Phypoly_transcript_05571:38-1876(+)